MKSIVAEYFLERVSSYQSKDSIFYVLDWTVELGDRLTCYY